ncbi:MAG: hypothetical protein V4580_15025 [Bacteroidota bacterium]
MKIFLSGMLLFCFVACTQKQEEKAETRLPEIEYSTYHSPEHSLTITYPKGWDTVNVDARMILTAREKKSSIGDTFRENIIVYKTQMPVKIKLDSVLNLAVAAIRQQYPEANILSTDIAKNAMNKEYATFQMVSPQNGIKLISVVYYFPKDNDFYVLNLGYNTKDSARYRPICDKVFNSFTFK